jgi:hypothetical protein
MLACKNNAVIASLGLYGKRGSAKVGKKMAWLRKTIASADGQ